MDSSSARSQRNTFAFSGLDRRSDARLDAAALALAQSNGLEIFVNEQYLIGGFAGALRFYKADPAIDAARWYLGEANQQHYFARMLSPDADQLAEFEWLDLRTIALQLSPLEAGIGAYARGLAFWHQRHRYCGSCGSATISVDAGHKRVCTNLECKAEHFPRTDPAIIVAVEYQQKILLGRQASWPPGRYSTLAGFVEPGESLEEALMREVFEESGARVVSCDYHSSQPWPFPSSLMLGFSAEAESEQLNVGDELEDARYYSLHEFETALADGSLKIPPAVSVSFRLIEAWYQKVSGASLAQLLDRTKAAWKA
jgi:NAD+ diphosphatase